MTSRPDYSAVTLARYSAYSRVTLDDGHILNESIEYCCVCGNNHSKDPKISFYRFPSDPTKRGMWLEMRESDVKSRMRVYSRDFPYLRLPTVP